MKFYRCCFFIIVSLFCSGHYANSADTLASDRLVSLLEPFDTLTGVFQQTLSDKQGQLIQDSTGEFALKRPGFFRWQTIEPYPQLLVSDLKKLWLYDPDLEQVTVREYTEALNKTPALLLSGDPKTLEDNYIIKKIENIDGANDGAIEGFVLVNKSDNSLFEQLTLYFTHQALSKMELIDSLGQLSVFHFTQTKAQDSLSAADFNFVPPAGVDVIIDDQ